MVSYSSNIFENDIGSIIILIVIINSLPNLINSYVGPQFLKSIKNNDLTRNFSIFLGILILTHISNLDFNKNLAAILIFVFLLIFSRQTFTFTVIEIVLATFIFLQYNKNEDRNFLWKYVYLLSVIMIYGYWFYYKKQLSDKGPSFSLSKFIFGRKQEEYDFDYQYVKFTEE